MEMPDRFRDMNFLQLAFTILFAITAFWPWIRDLWSAEARNIEEDLKGPDGKWSPHELRARDSMRVGRVFVVFLCTMMVFTLLFHRDFPEYLWAMFFFGTMGSSGVSAYLMRMGWKKEGQTNDVDA